MKAVRRILGVAISVAMLLGLALLSPSAARAASTDTKKAFIASVAAAAQSAQRQYGVPASALIAEAILDSNWGTSAQVKKARNYFNIGCRATMSASTFAKLAEAQVGKKYVLGAEVAISQSDPSKFDCSELVEWLYGRSGNRITDLAASQYDVTTAVSLDSPQVGDLVFLRNNPARANGIGHVAIVTKKIAGDWEIIEARGHAYGVVKTTLSYWRDRKYFAGLRRYPSFVLSDDSGVTKDANAGAYQYGCLAITADGSTNRYSYYTSVANSFADRAAIIANGGKYADAAAAMGDVNGFVAQLAKADQPKDAEGYAAKLRALISSYALTDYDVVPFTVVLTSGATGAKVTALQYLLTKAGYSVKVTGNYDAATKAAVKKFQSAKKLESDGDAGPITLTALGAQVSSGSSGDAVRALHSLLNDFGYATNAGASFKSTTQASLKAFQAAVGLSASGVATANTWAKLFMSVDPAPAPSITGTPTVDGTLTAVPGAWGNGSVTLSYQWYRGSTAIPGANAADYVAQAADVDSPLRVAVTGSQAPFTAITRFSGQTPAIGKATLTATPVPTISGTASVGQALSADSEAWGPGEVALSYQWYRGKKAIKGGTDKTYTLTQSDLGASLTVAVTGSRPGYQPVTQVSAASTPIAKGGFVTDQVKIDGTAKVGKKLSVSTGSWAAIKVAFHYQWYRGAAKIKGATKASYKAAKADRGKVLTVAVTGKASGFTSVTVKASTAKIG